MKTIIFFLFIAVLACKPRSQENPTVRTSDSPSQSFEPKEEIKKPEETEPDFKVPDAVAAGEALLGDEKGNGGDAFVCESIPKGFTQKVFSLDLFEAKYRFGLESDFPKGKSAPELVQRVLDRLARMDPDTGARLQSYFDQFAKEHTFVEARNLPSISDQGVTAIPPGCRLVQAAVQAEPDLPDEKFYSFNKEVWDALPEPDRAALMIHEFIYRWLTTDQCSFCDEKEIKRMYGQHVRYLYAWFASGKDWSFFEFLQILKDVKMPALKRDGVQIDLTQPIVKEGNVIKLKGHLGVATVFILPHPGGEKAISVIPESPASFVSLHFSLNGKLTAARDLTGRKNLFETNLYAAKDCPLFLTQNNEKTPLSSQFLKGIDYREDLPVGQNQTKGLRVKLAEGLEIDLSSCTSKPQLEKEEGLTLIRF